MSENTPDHVFWFDAIPNRRIVVQVVSDWTQGKFENLRVEIHLSDGRLALELSGEEARELAPLLQNAAAQIASEPGNS